MLTIGKLREELDAILDLLSQSKAEEAKQRIELILPEVSSEWGKGAVLALHGILNTTTKPKSSDQPLNPDRIQATTERIAKIQMVDDFDRGYLQTLARWAKRAKKEPEPASAPQQ